MKGYKVFNPDWACRGFQFEVGKEYVHDGDIGLCKAGFHFCRKLSDCFNYYAFDSRNKVAEIEAIGLVESDDIKSVTNKIKILREMSWHEVLDLCNEGTGCTGMKNTGNWNTGNCNTGNCNTGDWNTGNCNTGNCNTGDGNTGYGNTGDRNTGRRNTGSCNTGNGNTGNRNTGSCNTGNGNTGDWNTGKWNTGNCNTGSQNTGDWNTGNGNTGFFSTITPKIELFEKQTELTRKEVCEIRGIQILEWNYENNWWIYSANMTEKEKEEHPEHEALGGYIKTIPFKDACKMMWSKLTDEEKQAVEEIPNFDADIFEEITGIDVREEQHGV